jgi:hypothetical protein
MRRTTTTSVGARVVEEARLLAQKDVQIRGLEASLAIEQRRCEELEAKYNRLKRKYARLERAHTALQHATGSRVRSPSGMLCVSRGC